MDAETFRQTYRITTTRGRIVAQPEIWRAGRDLARALGVTPREVRAVLDDAAWMRWRAGSIPTRVGEDAALEAFRRRKA